MRSVVSRYRKRMSRTVKQLTKSRHLVLMYHRIANLDIDPWGLAVTTENFSEHLSVIKKLLNQSVLQNFINIGKLVSYPKDLLLLLLTMAILTIYTMLNLL
jgi:hypothetical protein